MISLDSLSDNDLLEYVVAVNTAFRKRFGKELGITGAYGEVNAAILWRMLRAKSHIQEGYDCTIGNFRIEVKCGVNRTANDTTSKISGHPFDYLLYVHYDENYSIVEAYILKEVSVREILSKRNGGSLRLREIRQSGRKVTPSDPLV